tara:strand:+ start:4782 stop:5399 length:618 start_codon:yes stop_codon:yes gene_type:complete
LNACTRCGDIALTVFSTGEKPTLNRHVHGRRTVQRVITTPLGPVTLTCENALLSRLEFSPRGECDRGVAANESDASIAPADAEIIQHASQQLHEYFSGQRTLFTLPLDARGTEFQQLAWRQLQTIPYAATRSYKWQCHAMGRPNAARAVGSANGRNPLPIIIPCHRVIGANGTLTGYSGGLAIKQFLLSCERFFGAAAGPSSSDR